MLEPTPKYFTFILFTIIMLREYYIFCFTDEEMKHRKVKDFAQSYKGNSGGFGVRSQTGSQDTGLAFKHYLECL